MTGERDPHAQELVTLGGLLFQAHQRAREAANAALRPQRVQLRDLGVLTALAAEGPLSQHALALALHLDKSAMVRIVDHLEVLGLVVRCRPARDRRVYEITLTDEGRARIGEGLAAAAIAMNEVLGDMSPADRRRLRGLLAKVAGSGPGT